MNMMRRNFTLSLGASTGLLLSGCASTSSVPALPTLKELGIYGAGAGSAFLPYAEGIAKFLSDKGLKTQALTSAGSIENIRKIDAEPNRVATVFLGTAYEGFTGTGAWTQGQKFTNLRALFPMYETSFQVAALRSNGITGVAQLAGKRVGVSPAGGPAESFFKGLIEAIGLQAQIVNGTPAALASDLLAGKIDALWQGAALPIPALKQVAGAADAVIFGLSEAELAAMLRRFPFLSRASIAANTYRGQGSVLQSVAAWNFIMAHKDLPELDAYWITQTVLSNAQPEQMHPTAAPTRAANAVHNSVIPFHPGAQRYYAQAGVRLPSK
ncbi:MAG: TAXI family TRAP transporter solute-binding subunit [Brachymonas sp.]|nr:TAXI family TRAP transporter solute-binding subunit [Brachymonas sp.]